MRVGNIVRARYPVLPLPIHPLAAFPPFDREVPARSHIPVVIFVKFLAPPKLIADNELAA